jgi:molybdate transport repressor ModE-like protein
MLNVQRLRILREISERGSITSAAEALFLTPSAVSQQMTALEREIGVPVLERVGRGVRLTEAGERLASRTEAVLAALEAAEADLAAVTTGPVGRLDVCAFPTAARVLLVPALVALRASYPRLHITMVDLEPEESLPRLRVGELDVVVTHEYGVLPSEADPAFEQQHLLTEPVFLALPKGHPRAGKSTSLADLRDEQFIVGRDASPFLDVVVRLAEGAGFHPCVDLHSNDFQVILAAVGAGLGVALVPPLALVGDYPDVVFQRTKGLELERRTFAAVRAGSRDDPSVSVVVEALRAAAATVCLEAPIRCD